MGAERMRQIDDVRSEWMRASLRAARCSDWARNRVAYGCYFCSFDSSP